MVVLILFNFEGPSGTRNLESDTRGCSSAGRAPALQAGGREFEPHHLHQGRRTLSKWGSDAAEMGP